MNKTVCGLALMVGFIATQGCVTVKEWSATGGSRADGTVVLSYTHGNFEQPTADDAQGLAIAEARCRGWGYQSAEAFGGAISRCTAPAYGGGCNFWQVDRQFQCVGQPDK